MLHRLRLGWNRVRTETSHFWSDDGPAGNCFWWIDTMLLLAGIRNEWSSRWKGARLVQYMSNALFAFEVAVLLSQVKEGLDDTWDDVANKLMGILKCSSSILASAKMLVMIHLREPLGILRNYVLDDRVNSGDKVYDEFEQRKLNQTARFMFRAMLGLLIAEMTLLSIPNQTMASMFRMPPWGASNYLYHFFVTTLPLGLLPRLLSHMSYVGILIMGMRMKLGMMAHRYQRMTSASDLDLDQYFEGVNRELRETFKQQVEFLGHFNTLAEAIGKTFLIIHYYSIFSIGTIIFMGKHMGVNVFSAAFVLMSLALLLEYYVWCYLVDSIHETAASIGDHIYEICAIMPYSREYHRKYIQLRTSFIIIWINNCNGYSVDCFGLLQLSIIAFVNLLDVAYTVLMFLINMA
ncbi:uncharacterized protein LOC23687386 [Aedes aegypti]|uniref:Uncharacterized protein n=1 Tax=Aedes aegypti TaxID=7159 RepID=A0A1S4G4M3_AEDAE|nr:odorant receptor 104 [Aedes aegypti]